MILSPRHKSKPLERLISHHSDARTRPPRVRRTMSRFPLRVLLALIALIALPTASLASGEPLHIGNFQRTLDADELWVVEIMSPMCGTCQTFAPVWQGFSAKHGTKVKVGQVNIDTEDGMELAVDMGVLAVGVPSVWAFAKADGEGINVWKDETGAVPTVDALATAVFGLFENQRVTAEGFWGKTVAGDAGEL